jgi:hypothetical protein
MNIFQFLDLLDVNIAAFKDFCFNDKELSKLDTNLSEAEWLEQLMMFLETDDE